MGGGRYFSAPLLIKSQNMEKFGMVGWGGRVRKHMHASDFLSVYTNYPYFYQCRTRGKSRKTVFYCSWEESEPNWN